MRIMTLTSVQYNSELSIINNKIPIEIFKNIIFEGR